MLGTLAWHVVGPWFEPWPHGRAACDVFSTLPHPFPWGDLAAKANTFQSNDLLTALTAVEVLTS